MQQQAAAQRKTQRPSSFFRALHLFCAAALSASKFKISQLFRKALAFHRAVDCCAVYIYAYICIFEKYQGLKEQLERMWKVKASVVPVVVGALRAVTPKLGEWLQQIPGTTSEASVQKSAVLGTAKILRRTLKLPGLW